MTGKQRFLAYRVASDLGHNRYRLVGLARPEDRTGDLGRGNLPDQVVIVGEEKQWEATVSVSMSGSVPGVLLTDRVGLSVEN